MHLELRIQSSMFCGQIISVGLECNPESSAQPSDSVTFLVRANHKQYSNTDYTLNK